MSAFDTDSVAIIRKTGDRDEKDEINTAPVFPGSDRERERERIRAGVIARLRKDPTVILVLEDRGGKAEERIRLRDGFEMTASLVDGGFPTMRELGQLFIYEVIDSSVKLNRLNL